MVSLVFQATALLQAGIQAHQLGEIAQAEAIYRDILSRDPKNADAHHLTGVISFQRGRYVQAVEQITKAIELNPNNTIFFSNRGNALMELKRFEDAIFSFEEAIRLMPAHHDAFNNRGISLSELRRLDEALSSFDEAIRLRPDYAEAFNNRGVTLKGLERLDDALSSFDEAIRLKPDYSEAFNNRGLTLQDLKRFEESLPSFGEAIRFRPDYADAFNNCGITLKELKRFEEALVSFNEAIRLEPNRAAAFNNRGLTLKELKRFEEALVSFNEAIRLEPDQATAFNNRGNALRELKRLDEAIASFDEAIRLKPDYATAFNNRGISLKEHMRFDEAISSFEEAVRIKPDYADALSNCGIALSEHKRLDEALKSLNEAIRIKPDSAFLPGTAAQLRAQISNWAGLGALVTSIEDGVSANKLKSPPFSLLALVDDSRLHLRASDQWVREKVASSGTLGSIIERPRSEKIHIAYASADFRDHPVSYLLAEMFESHDRARFEVTAISFGPDDGQAMRRRISAGVDRFEEVRCMSDINIARRCRELGVDVAVDLMGFTGNGRTGIFAERGAPIQINWLGYPGTMAASFIDYIIADPTLIAESDLKHYTEKVIWLPDTYQVNDTSRQISDKNFTRAECDLPESGFVFCCFNNSYKVLPATFDVWMRLLHRVPGSVMWLLEDNATASRNLRTEAISRGIDPDRLVFASRLPLPQHLARHRVADLFIDTWPYNAHTTASDALWAGLPVLTKSGRSFASRVAASLLNAIGLPELITQSEQDYEELAVAIAQDSNRLQALKEKLCENRLKYPLFDCKRFTKNLESAYSQVMERHWAGAEPDHLSVAAVL
jgi:predicted O-linked N-acetylglucosamine transferase (SPINDLY family)